MPEMGLVKYLVRLKFEVEGVVEKADVIGAIFGQTEGLFGPEMNLNELQKAWKVGRIEIQLTSKGDRTTGEVLIPMATDVSTAALIAAAVESVEKVGPCAAHFRLEGLEDVRAAKRKVIVERAKVIIKEWASRTASEGEDVLRGVAEVTRRARVIAFGREGLPAGPGVYTAETVYLVEGRADVIALLRAGVENVVALEGTKVPESIVRLAREKRLIAVLDGDRGGDLILRELEQVAPVTKVVRAPAGKEVEDLTPMEILELLRAEAPVVPTRGPVEEGREMAAPGRAVVAPPASVPTELVAKVREVYAGLNGTLEGVVLDEGYRPVLRVPVNELVRRLGEANGGRYVVFDGIVTARLVEACGKAGIRVVVGHRLGEMAAPGDGVVAATFRELGLE